MDINHVWGADVALGADGDLALVDGDDELLERLLRRLMTNNAISGEVPGDYPFHQTYGASVPRRIGQTRDLSAIESQIQAQMLQESGVSHNPEPVVTVRNIQGGVQCRLQFTSALTGQPHTLELPL